MSHPRYANCSVCAGPCHTTWGPDQVLIGDEVADLVEVGEGLWDSGQPLGTVTDIHGESFGDGPGDTITVIPAAVTLSTGDRYPVADLVLLQRAKS